mmetsp:Transcript_49757/g.130871  ORF Transcript_49757/g.130871 Transcript_49757/m.130871 type:complete len:332 (+) Transcript_49757:168-1163(+)
MCHEAPGHKLEMLANSTTTQQNFQALMRDDFFALPKGDHVFSTQQPFFSHIDQSKCFSQVSALDSSDTDEGYHGHHPTNPAAFSAPKTSVELLYSEDEIQAVHTLLAREEDSSSRKVEKSTADHAALMSQSSGQHHDSSDGVRRSYRQHTSELILKLDKLLDFRALKASKGKKSLSRKNASDIFKPRARNVVLKQATELIKRMMMDDKAVALLKSNRASPVHVQPQPASAWTNSRPSAPEAPRATSSRSSAEASYRQAAPASSSAGQYSSPMLQGFGGSNAWAGRDGIAASCSRASGAAIDSWDWMSARGAFPYFSGGAGFGGAPLGAFAT